MYHIFPSGADWIKLSSKIEMSYIISLVAAIGGLSSKTLICSRKHLGVFLGDTMYVGNIAVPTKGSISRSTI